MTMAARTKIPGRMLWISTVLVLALAPAAEAGWSLWNDPHGDVVRQKVRTPEPAKSAQGQNEAAAKVETARRELEQAEAASQAAKRRLEEEMQAERIRRLALQERAEAQREAEQQRLALEAAELKRLQERAAQERAEAQRQAEQQRLVLEAAELKRLKERSAQEWAEAQHQVEQQRLALETAELKRLQERAEAQHQAEQQRLALEAGELKRMQERAAAERQAVPSRMGQPAQTAAVQSVPNRPAVQAPPAPPEPQRVLEPPAAAEPAARPELPRATAGEPGYRIGPGDLLDVAVWKDEALTRSLVVSPDGRISFPLVGLIEAEGKTVEQLRGELERKISPFVPEPVISVEVRQVNSLQVYIIGRVNAPGRFQLSENISVLQALAMAGGLTPFADRSEIKVMRQDAGETRSYPFHYDKVVKGQRLDENILLQRGDVIVVP